MTKSAPTRNSENCRIPSPLTSEYVNKLESRDHCAIHAGNASIG